MKYLSTLSFFLAGLFWSWFGYSLPTEAFPVFLFLTSIILASTGISLFHASHETQEGHSNEC